MSRCWGIVLIVALAGCADDSGHPLPPEILRMIEVENQQALAAANRALQDDPNDAKALGNRGDAHFFLGKFPEAVADYDAMVKVDPSLDESNWRRGIALFYAGDYEKAAAQFERYHSFDNVDRENGIWRYLCQVKQGGVEEARKGLLKYEKDDREPFPDVFKLFAGTITPEEIREHISTAKITDDQKQQRRFYADLYIGLNHAVEGRDDEALTSLRRAVANDWPPQAGFGPRWMWNVARVHYEQLKAAAEKK